MKLFIIVRKCPASLFKVKKEENFSKKMNEEN